MAEPVLETSDLSFIYSDGTTALQNINLRIMEGEKVSLVGPNGAGKSTLILQFNGILRGKGLIYVAGIELTKKTVTMIRRKVGVVFQDPNDQLFCPTVFEDVSFGPLHFGISEQEIKELVARSLYDVGLEGFENKSSHHLSLGERRRVSIAAVLACRPDIILLDEPTANLDPKHRRSMINMINSWKHTTVVATHDLDLAWETCERSVIINKGIIQASGTREEILKNEPLLKSNDLELPLRFQTN